VKVDPVTLEELKSADGEPFRQLFAIYAASITPREQKPEDWLRAMVAAPEYRVWIAQDTSRVLGFSLLFVPPGEGFALLEYMAVSAEKRGHGFGGELFRRTVEHAVTPKGAGLPVLLEVDSDREASSDQVVRTRRVHFYRRLGCVKIAGLRYLMPLRGVGPVPEMDLMVYPAAAPAHLARAELQRWLQTIYRDVYHGSPDDPRIAQMLQPLPDPVLVE
jgi:GNAT superfamily N-acetyltransferase